jgi:DNA-directed RNA polymerase subunit beta
MPNSKRINLSTNPVPHLDMDFLEAQKSFFRDFMENGFEELFDEINPIQDYTGSSWELSFEEVEWGKFKTSFRDAQLLGQTYDAPVHVNVRLVNKKTGEIKKQKIYLCDMPLMSERASFMVNGNERVVVFQILRSEGVLFSESKNSSPKKRLYSVKLMPHRGNWYEFEVNKYGVMSIKLLQKRPRILLTTLLRALGFSSDAEIKKVLGDADVGEMSFIDATLKKDPAKNTEEALIDIYRKLRPEDTVTLENARALIDNIFFNKRRFYLGKIGRYKVNKKLNINEDIKTSDYILKRRDIVEVIKCLLKLNHGTIQPDDIDSLSNRRIRGVNELVAEKIRVGVLIVEKNIRDKMSTFSTDEKVTPAMLVNTRPIISAVNQFFGSSALMRFMDQENPLSELEAKRKISAGGPRGLTKERATFSVRDVHNSHYSRLCPVTTPEGPSIGMVNQLAIYTKINQYGFLEAPYFPVLNKIVFETDKHVDFIGRYFAEDVSVNGKVIAKKDSVVDEKTLSAIEKSGVKEVKIKPFIKKEAIYLDADNEITHKIASSSIKTDAAGNILDLKTYVRDGQNYTKLNTNEVDLVDVSPAQIAGMGLALIPFAGNDDPNRTLIGAKTQNQSIPLVKNESPIVGTGFEVEAAKASGRGVYAEEDGKVLHADANKVVVQYKNQKDKTEYSVEKFVRTNQNTSFSQTPIAMAGESFKKGDILIDGPCTRNGELALGVNLRTAYVVYDGYNYEDGIVINERLVKEDILTSVHIQEYVQEVRETKLGNEQITRDIPGVGEWALRNLDEDGVVRIGASVQSNDILVGIIAPKGESELTAEEKLLRAIFGEYARDVRDNSLRIPHGDHGVVIDVQILDRSSGAKLNAGVIKQVKVWVAKTHKISIGDKLTGYHGDKGVITKIVPEEDMPYTADGKPVDIILGPTGMIRRMNLGQLIETHIGNLAQKLGVKVEVQPFSEYSLDPLLNLAKEKGVAYEEKVDLYDGRNGDKYKQKVTVGMKYFFKLDHLADHKIHARSTGPYTLVTQQPLRGKAQRGGRRFGEMEVWALEAHAVPNVLHEMLTIKSDDVVGRAAAYKAIISGNKITAPNVPESFNVLDKELAGLAIKMDKINAEYDEERGDMALEEIVDAVGNDLPSDAANDNSSF